MLIQSNYMLSSKLVAVKNSPTVAIGSVDPLG